MKDVWTSIEEDPSNKKINKKKIIITVSIALLIIILIAGIICYNMNEQIRSWIDKNIFRKEVMQDNVATIDISKDENASIYTFNKYIGILDKTKFKIYNASGNEENELDIQISNPIFNSENRFLVIAETKGKKIYLLEDKEILWEDNVDGSIAKVHVNKNGYVAVVIVGTSSKTVIKMYDPQGNPMFNTFLSSTTIDVSISNDNKYLAIAEVDTSGTVIQSNIRVIPIDKAEKERTNLEDTYKSEAGKLITNIKYQNKNKLVCMYTDGIAVIENGKQTNLVDNNEKKAIFQSISLSNYACLVEEKSSGLFTADSLLNLINIDNGESKEYIADSVAKEIYAYGDKIALNLGTEVEFVNTSGWLVKRYIAKQEITNIVVSDSLAGIVYRDKIEIVNL